MLISAFRATLEEVRAADVIVHVRDISHADSEAQSAGRRAQILAELGASAIGRPRDRSVNKLDQLDDDRRDALRAERTGRSVGAGLAVSALTGEGMIVS